MLWNCGLYDYNYSTALRYGSFSKKKKEIEKKNTCALQLRIIITFANQMLF